MAESVYTVIELVEPAQSLEKAAMTAVNTASKASRDLRVAEIVQIGFEHRKMAK